MQGERLAALKVTQPECTIEYRDLSVTVKALRGGDSIPTIFNVPLKFLVSVWLLTCGLTLHMPHVTRAGSQA